jgi:micrococcal nuclease
MRSRTGRLPGRGLILLLVLVALALAVGIALARGRDEAPAESADDTVLTTLVSGTGGADGTALAGVAVTLVEVIDGDTIRVRMPDRSEERVRYIGIDAPEVARAGSPGEYLADEATAHNATLLESGPLILETDVEQRDDFGRLLAYVWAGELFVNERMVADGYAWAHDYPPNLARQDGLWAASESASSAGLGIWALEDE